MAKYTCGQCKKGCGMIIKDPDSNKWLCKECERKYEKAKTNR